ncbi:MAG: response regulator [Acidobacteriota bacterium]
MVLALQRTDSEDPSTVQVLFVDDEPDLEHLIRRWIQRGLDHNVAYDVKFARDGKEALEVLAANPSISLLFTDLRMPQLDGIGLLRELRRHNKFCVAVVVSAFGDLKNIRSAMNLGAFDFLTKPFDFEDLGKTLGKAVQQMVTVRESIRLRAENQLLEERNKVIQVAFSRFLQGDPELAQAFSPLIDYLQGEDGRPLTVLTLSLEGVNDMTLQLASPQLVPLLRQFLEEIVVITRLHRGEVLRLEQQHLSVGFDLRARGVDVGRARSCARDFRQAVFRLSNQSEERGGPAIHAKFAIDSGEVTIDSQTGDLSGSVIDRMGDLLDQCKVDEILVTDRARGTDPPGQGATATTLADF